MPTKNEELTKKLYNTTDAMEWAKEFVKIVDESDVTIDVGLMVGWFANAMWVQECETRGVGKHMDSMRFEVDPVEVEQDQWFGEVVVKSSGGIKRTIYTTTGHHESSTKAENAAVSEFSIHLSQALSGLKEDAG